MSLRPDRLPWPTILRAVLVTCLLAAGFAGGWTAHGLRQEPAGRDWHAIREQGAARWRYINPLLECAANEDLIQQPELISFRNRLKGYVNARQTSGDITLGSVYFLQLHDGLSISVNRRRGYVPASLLKLPTLIAVLKRAEKDPQFLSQRVVFPGASDENRLLVYHPPATLQPGTSYTVEELARHMVRYSDNNATGLLNSIVPFPEQQEAMLGLGVLPEWVASEGRLTVKSVSSFLRVLYNASYLNRENSELALEMLSQSSFREGIIAGIPADVSVCSKYAEAATGPESRQLHEFAIVYHPLGPYLLGVMAEGSDFGSMARFIRDVSQLVYQEVDRQAFRLENGADFGDGREGASRP